MISSNTVLAFYDPKKPTVVCADASSHGIGGVLMQSPSDQLRQWVFAVEHSQRLRSHMLKLRKSAWQHCEHVRDYHVI